jgi:hypothetical protein
LLSKIKKLDDRREKQDLNEDEWRGVRGGIGRYLYV